MSAAPTVAQPTQGRARALVLAVPDAPDPVVAGLTVTERWRRSLRDHGVADVIVVSAEEAQGELAAVDGPAVIAWGDSVAEHLALEWLIEHAASTPDGVVRTLALESGGPLAPVVTLGRQAAAALGAAGPGAFGCAEEVRRALEESGQARVEPVVVPEGYWGRVTDAASARQSAWKLMQRLRWRPGGLVAKHLNRPISTRLSYWLVNTRVTPNQTTWFAFLLGAIGVGFIFRGGYGNTVLGTALLQLNSVVDGIDGELARMRHETSEFGAYLDSVCDEVLNTGTMIGVGYNLSTFQYGGNPLYLILGTFAGVMNFIYALVHWHCKYKHGLGFYWWFEAYKPRREVQRSTSVFSYLKKLTMKESYLFLFLVAAIFQVLEVMIWPFAVAGLAVLVLFIIHIPIKRARW